MNYLDKIKNALKPQLHEVELHGISFWVHRPTMKDFASCDTLENTLVLCVKDENGDPIFSKEYIDGRVDVTQLDFTYANELYREVTKLLDIDSTDAIEKK